MLFLSTSLESLLSEHVSGQLLLTIFLLLLISCFSVNSYRIDSSCQNYKGVNITGDIKQAINELQQMASYAFDRDHSRSANTVRTLRVLFGDNLSSHAAVTGFFQNLSNAVHTQEFTVICGDEMVKLAGDLHGPLGLWVDRVHNWHMKYHIYNPCDPARKLNGPDIMVDAFTISAQLIYLCPRILDHPKGRSLATYRDRVVTGESINDYFIVPAILFHELLHTSIAFRKLSSRWRHHITLSLTRDLLDSHRCDGTRFAYAQRLQESPHRRLRSRIC